MAKAVRTVARKFAGAETMEGAGVRLRRMFGNSEVPLLDPFLLLDNFGSTNPADYVAGFPWHPHRGLETVTYMMRGKTEHEDSLGNKGVIDSGDVQWMSAGSGIMHQEMPRRTEGLLSGFQLWVNLPRGRKMETPAYRGGTDGRCTSSPGSSTRWKVRSGTSPLTRCTSTYGCHRTPSSNMTSIAGTLPSRRSWRGPGRLTR